MDPGVRLFQLLVEHVDDYAIIAMDLRAVVVHWNRGAEKITGYTAEEVCGKRIDHIFTPEDVAAGVADKEIEIAARLGHAADERWHIRKDGSRFWAYGLMVQIKSTDGEHVGYGKFLRDRTDLKQLQETLQRQLETLKGFDEGRKRFMATLAHELRTPLTVLSSSAYSLKRMMGDNAQARAELERIERQVRVTSNLAADLADLAHVQRQKIAFSPGPVDFRSCVRESARAVDAAAGRREHRLEVVVPDEPVMIVADAARIQQVLVNLLTNAVRYTPAGGKIGLSLQTEDRDAVARVSDNGIGIPPDRIANIFDLFTQVHEDYSETQAGLGIGLNLAQELVRLQGGTIQARSDGAGKGSEFVVRFPLLSPVSTRVPGGD